MDLLREKIDEIDEQILHLLEQRQQAVWDIARKKRLLNLPARDKKRFDEMLGVRLRKAAKMNLDQELVRNIFDVIHESSVKYQEKLNAK